MVHRNDTDPSPFRSGLLHGVMSLAVFGGVFGLVAGLVHLTGDPEKAGPKQVIALFESDNDGAPALRKRAPGDIILANVGRGNLETNEPSLGVADPSNTAPASQEQTAQAVSSESTRKPPGGIRINGKLVNPGQSYSDVEANAAQAASTVLATATQTGPAETELAAQNEVTNPNARPFENPTDKPIVSLVIGGLGAVSYTHLTLPTTPYV